MASFDRNLFPPDLKAHILAKALVDGGLATSGSEGVAAGADTVWIYGVPPHRAADLNAFVASYTQGPEPVPTRIESATVIPSPGQVLDLGSSASRWGDVYATSLITLSDANKKEAIEPISTPSALGLIMELEPVSYRMKDFDAGNYGPQTHRRRHMGFVAQQVAAVLGEKADDCGLWCCDSDGNQSLRYEQLISPLVKVVQEQQRRIEALESLVRETTNST